ncbi:UNVERIFIED_CONTAM: hypothetical protein Slati_2139800 [Sesamum latifolium]|uniref:Uncharacterized protein n=1 Tax=Sesamum latifolium TaxID=2727402 RepID=A0AAW2WSC7_9LAMI
MDIQEQIVTLAPLRTATTSDVGVPEEEAEEGAPAHAPPTAGRQGLPLYPSGGSPAMARAL